MTLIGCGHYVHFAAASAPSHRDCVDLKRHPAVRFHSHCSVAVGQQPAEIAKCLAFSHFPFREQCDEEFCPTRLNRWSGGRRRNARMEDPHRVSYTRRRCDIRSANRSSLTKKDAGDLSLLGLADDAYLRTTRHRRERCAEPPRLC